MTTVCLCVVAFTAVMFFAYLIHMLVLSRLDRLERKMEEINPVSIVYGGKRQNIADRVEKLEKDVMELNQFYYIPGDSDDKSLVDMYKDLKERCNKLYQMMSDRIMDINDLRFKYEVLKSSYPKQSEYKITVGDDPNQMQNGTTVSTMEKDEQTND